ncbi:MbtH family protein [Streptomyces noursei]|uniref:MbtH family protein n=1 Tax=Streptomyces noursei TaxID=1971 RepID=UPI0023B81452|nr:MbtH family NRPS accessory protein [Streptomyces noursei]
MSEDKGTQEWTVVVNDEEQYSIWAVNRQIPGGWKEIGVRGTQEECLSHIEQVWSDMRPLSLRLAMDAAG